MNILFIGGDKRSRAAYEKLKNDGFNVSSYGLFSGDTGSCENADFIVLPVPSTKDKINVFSPFSEEEIPLKTVTEKIQDKFVISCGLTVGENCTDILKLDNYCLKNAVPTAEGAISYAIENTPFTLWKSKVLIIGNGRVAKVLISRLLSFGCHLTVSARKPLDFALLDTQNIEFINTNTVPYNAGNFDIIFNTVDAHIFKNPSSLKNAMLIDLSSKGCIDFERAKMIGINAVKLPGIPGKTAPHTSGIILYETIKQIINSKCEKDLGESI